MKYSKSSLLPGDLGPTLRSKEQFENTVKSEVLRLAKSYRSVARRKLYSRVIYLCSVSDGFYGDEEEERYLEMEIKKEYLKGLVNEKIIENYNIKFINSKHLPVKIVTAQIRFVPKVFTDMIKGKLPKNPKFRTDKEKGNEYGYIQFPDRHRLVKIGEKKSEQCRLLKMLLGHPGTALSLTSLLEEILKGSRKQSTIPTDTNSHRQIAEKIVRNKVREIQRCLKKEGFRKRLFFIYSPRKNSRYLTLLFERPGVRRKK